MSVRAALVGGSLLAHAGLVMALGGIRAPRVIAPTAISVVEASKPEPPPPPSPEPPPPPEAPAVRRDAPRVRAAKAAPADPPPEAAPSPSPSLGDLPDFGLELGNAGPGGLAVPAPAAPPTPRAPATTTKMLAKAPAPSRAVDACDEPPAKPKLLHLPRPAYTDAARAANVEGKVRVEITVDETGKVVSVRALTSLGHGLDEAALDAARAATFEPAVRCGRPSRSTFIVSIRFSAS